MKIVQSLWSAPARESGGWEKHDGSWPQPRFFWYSWVLSTSWAFKHYGNVELISDHEGARWLVDKLQLPFTTVRADELENLDVPGHLWAFGKIVAYAAQREPFFHIDGDVYLMGKLPARYEKAELLCQFFEQAPAYTSFPLIYDVNRTTIELALPHLPDFWKFMSERSAANCGIMGGCNIDAIQRYAKEVIEMVKHPENRPHWKTIQLNRFASCVIEQQTLWCSARQQGLTLTPLFENTDFTDLEAFRRKALELNFNHAAGHSKHGPFKDELARRVENEYPRQFRAIEEMFPRKKLRRR